MPSSVWSLPCVIPYSVVHGCQVDDAYTVLLREKKLPLSLLQNPEAKTGGKAARVHLLQTQPFKETFGTRHIRKKPKLASDSYQDLLSKAEQTNEK